MFIKGYSQLLSLVIISNQDQISAYQAYIFLISVLELFYHFTIEYSH